MSWRTRSRKVVLLATLLAVVFSNLVGIGTAFASDNRPEIQYEASRGGWELISIYHLNHAEYIKIAAVLATPGGLAQEILGKYTTIVEKLYTYAKYALIAHKIVDIVVDALHHGDTTPQEVLNGDVTLEVKVMLLTYDHWHDEKVPTGDCDVYDWEITCDSEWVKVNEPNTHELVLAVREKPSDSSPVEADVACNGTIFVDAAYTGIEHGTAASPFRTVTAAYLHACDGAVLQIRGGTYAEQWTFDKRISVTFTAAKTGIVRIGQGSTPGIAAAAQTDTSTVIAEPVAIIQPHSELLLVHRAA